MNMKSLALTCLATLTCLSTFSGGASQAQILFGEDFDLDATANWTTNAGIGFDTNFDPKPVDTAADYFFDYSSVGIPPAPNSVGGTTRGMKLQADLTADAFGGFSVSPTGESFAGDYSITFDAWSNTVGPFPNGGSGSTNLSMFGLLTSGTVSNVASHPPGQADGVWFAYTGDGASARDYRAYSAERPVSYEIFANSGIAEDAHVTYHAGGRNASDPLYVSTFGSQSAPQVQVDLFPNQTGSLSPGSAAFAWHEHEMRKTSDTIEWFVNDILLVTLETTDFTVPTGGNNILFGHQDINFSSSTDPNDAALIFTLVDNIQVSVVPEPTSALLLGMCLGAFCLTRGVHKLWGNKGVKRAP